MSTAAATSGHCLLAIVACLSVILQTLAAFRATTTISRTNESSRSETRVPTFDCSVRIDQNTVYDLSLLRRHSGEAAFVATTAAFDTKSRYAIKRSELIFLNICGHLPNASDESNACIKQHPNTAVCLLDQSTNQTRSLGDFDANTSLNFNNQTTALQLIYYYRNETIVEINLFCSPGNTDSSPILLEMKKRAGRIKYFFDWQISAACPSGISVGSNCSVVESNLGVLFDLNSLQTTNSYIASSKDHIFYLNVCGEAKECGTGFAACLYSKNNTKQALLGKVNSSLIYFHGVLKLIYEDRSQYNNKTVPFRRTEIDFICNETIGKGEPKFLSEANSTYFFKWETKYACRFPIATANCVWQNGTHTIDLGPLSLAQGNHFAHYFGFEHFLINVCKPVNPFNALGTSVSCGRNVGICKIDWQNNNKTFSYGQPLDPPFQLYDGSIALKYQNGDPCPTNHSKRTKSIIRFLCDQSEDTGFPIFKGKFENEDECTFMFDWKTFFVCSPKRIYLEDQCRFKDNRTGLEADLSDIDADSSESRLIHVFLGEIETLSINVCKISNYFNSPACKDAVVCLKRNDKTFLSLGNIHHKEAQFDGKSLWFYYSNGSNCINNQTYSTSIRFHCSKTGHESSPKFEKLDGCKALFSWETKLVCDLHAHEHKCTLLTDKHFYDLRKLSSVSHAWQANDTEGNVYWLNICNLLPNSANCYDPKSSVCMCTHGTDCQSSLGNFWTQELRSTPEGDLELLYTEGHTNECPRNASSKITFKCGPVRGNPKFLKREGCTYSFEWKTTVACPINEFKEVKLEEANGYIFDHRINFSYYVKPFFEQAFNVTGLNSHTDDIYFYLINLSNATLPDSEKCKNASVCQMKISPKHFERDIGSFRNYHFLLAGNDLELVVESSSSQICGKNSRKNVTSRFILECSSTLNISEPDFLYESNNCDYFFRWRSKYLCFNNGIQGRYIPPKDSSKVPAVESIDEKDRDGKSSLGSVILVFLLLIILAFVGFVLFSEERRTNVARRIRRLFGPTITPSFQYSQLSTNDILAHHHNEVAFITRGTSSFSPYSDTTLAKDQLPSTELQMTVPYSIYDDSDVNLLT